MVKTIKHDALDIGNFQVTRNSFRDWQSVKYGNANRKCRGKKSVDNPEK